MERLYAIDFERARGASGGEILRGMRAAVGRAKRTAGGERHLTGIALGERGEKLLFCFRLGKK
ncbi:MAG: hypothetical protein ACM3ZC_03440 [Bacteroidota bacterium]